MDERADESCGGYSLEEEDERFRRDLETALELSLQEQSMRGFSDSLEWTLKEIQVEVSRPVTLSKDDPVSAEIRADPKRQEVDVLEQKLAQTSLRSGATPEKKVLQRLSQGRTWAQRVLAGSCREDAGASSENCRGDTSASPHSEDFDVDNIPRCPVGEGAVKKVPRRQRPEKDHSERNGKEVLSHGHSQKPSNKKPLQRTPALPPRPAREALLRPDPEDKVPQPQRGKKEVGWSTPPSDTEEFLRELEIARQKSLLENWAPSSKTDSGLATASLALTVVTDGKERHSPKRYSSPLQELLIEPNLLKQAPAKSSAVDADAHASAKTGCKVTENKPAEEIYDWLSHAQQYDPQLAKMTRAIKRYLARTGDPGASLPCKHCADKCTCIYVTADYLDEFGMTEAVCKSCDVEILSTDCSESFGGSSEYTPDSGKEVASKKTGELGECLAAAAVETSPDVQRKSCEGATARDDADMDSDPAAFIERWYTSALEGQSSGSEAAANSATDPVSAEILTGSPLVTRSEEDNHSTKSGETNGWTSGAEFGNEKLRITSSPSWNTASRVWRPVADDALVLGQVSSSPRLELLLKTLPSVENHVSDEENGAQSYHATDENSPDRAEDDSELAHDWCPDIEKD